MEYNIYKTNPYWVTGGPWYNTSIWEQLQETVFEHFNKNTSTGRYKFMFLIDEHDKNQPSVINDGISGGGNALLSNEKTDLLV